MHEIRVTMFFSYMKTATGGQCPLKRAKGFRVLMLCSSGCPMLLVSPVALVELVKYKEQGKVRCVL